MKKVIIGVLTILNICIFVLGLYTIIPNVKMKLEHNDMNDMLEETMVAQEQEFNFEPEGKDEMETEMETMVSDEFLTGTGSELSTTERPSLEDFLWYTENVMYEGVPVDVIDITDLSRLTGSWKSLIMYDPEGMWGPSGMSFSNTDISGNEEELTLTVDWYMTFWSQEGQSVDESNQDDAAFNGKWENDGLWASGPGTIRITRFYEWNEKQYAIGTMDSPDGIPANVALIRP